MNSFAISNRGEIAWTSADTSQLHPTGAGDREAVEGSVKGGVLLVGSVPGRNRPLRPLGTSPFRGGFLVSESPAPMRKKHKTLGAPDSTIRNARRLRKSMSLPEVLLWQQLKLRPGGYQFRKQHPFGHYVLDFVCVRARLAVEVDGEAHGRGDRPGRDDARDRFVLGQGFRTLRFPAADVLKNMEGAVTAIIETCAERAKPNPPRNGEVARSDGGAGLDEAQASTVCLAASGPPPRSREEFA